LSRQAAIPLPIRHPLCSSRTDGPSHWRSICCSTIGHARFLHVGKSERSAAGPHYSWETQT
jgi:hypothetical protein